MDNGENSSVVNIAIPLLLVVIMVLLVATWCANEVWEVHLKGDYNEKFEYSEVVPCKYKSPGQKCVSKEYKFLPKVGK